MEVIKPTKVTTVIKNKKTGEEYKTEEEWKAKNIAEGKTKQYNKPKEIRQNYGTI